MGARFGVGFSCFSWFFCVLVVFRLDFMCLCLCFRLFSQLCMFRRVLDIVCEWMSCSLMGGQFK